MNKERMETCVYKSEKTAKKKVKRMAFIDNKGHFLQQ